MRVRSLMLLAALALAGCSDVNGPYPDDLARFDAAPSCCTGYADFPYRPLRLGSEQDVSLSADSPAFVFPTGKSYFTALKIPEGSPPFYLHVVSWAEAHRVFYPSVLVLDGLFRPTRHVGAPVFRWQDQAHFGSSATIEGTLYVDPASSGERYIILLTTQQAQSSYHAAGTAPQLSEAPLLGNGRDENLADILPQSDILLTPGPVGRVTLRSGRL